jgi:hypothetical protein
MKSYISNTTPMHIKASSKVLVGLKIMYEYMKRSEDINERAYAKAGLDDISQGNLLNTC